MTRNRSAGRAVTATAGIALVALGGFGLLAQPHADAAGAAPNDLCLPPLIPCPSQTPTSTTTTSTTTTSQPTQTTSASTSAPAEPSSPTQTYSVGTAPQAQQAAPTGPAPGPNLAVSHLVVRKVGSKLDVVATVANPGTVLLRNVPLSVSASGVGTQHWTVTLNPGQHLSFHTRWAFRPTPKAKKVTVVLDPQNLIAETTKADNRVSTTKRFR